MLSAYKRHQACTIFDRLSQLEYLLPGASPLLLVLCLSSAEGVWFRLLTFIAAGSGQKKGEEVVNESSSHSYSSVLVGSKREI